MLEICSFKLSKCINKNEKILDYLLDIIKITWGLFFNELTNDEKCIEISYCELKLQEYLQYIGEYIPKYQQEILMFLKNKDESYKKTNELIFGLVKILIQGATVALIPEFAPIVFGCIEIGEEIFKSLNNNEKINWGKVFWKGTKGALQCALFKFNPKTIGTVGKLLLEVAVPPIFDYAESKIDGKDYNFVEGLSRNGIETIAGKVAEINVKKIFPKDFFKNISCNNEGIKKM